MNWTDAFTLEATEKRFMRHARRIANASASIHDLIEGPYRQYRCLAVLFGEVP